MKGAVRAQSVVMNGSQIAWALLCVFLALLVAWMFVQVVD